MNELKKSNLFLSVVIPMYNESSCIIKTVSDVWNYLTNKFEKFEIIVVDDGSQDKGAEKIRTFTKQHIEVKIIVNTCNHGKGAVVRQGLNQAVGEYLLFMDADQSTKINEIEKVLPKLKNNKEIFISSRYIKGSKIVKKQPLIRRIISRLANIFIQVLFLPKIYDTQNGFKIFSRKAYKAIESWLTINGWAFDIEMLYVAKRLKIPIYEFPITWQNSDKSNLSIRKDLKKFYKDFIRIWRQKRAGFYPG